MPERKVFVDYSALWGALNTARQTRRMSWRDVAKAIGTSPSTFTRLANGKGTDADTFVSLTKWLQVDAEEFMRGRPPSRRGNATTATLAVISGHLRADPRLGPEQARQMDSIISAAYKALTAERQGRSRATRVQTRG